MAEITAQIEALWREHPEPASQLVMQERQEPRMTSLLNRGDFLKPVKEVEAGSARRFCIRLRKRRRRTDATGFRALARGSAIADDGPVVRQSRLAGVLRRRAGGDVRRSRHAKLAAVASGIARLARRGIHGARLERQASASADRAIRRRTGSRRASPRNWRNAIRKTGCLRAGRGSGSTAKLVRDIALAASGLSNPKIGGPSVHPPAPEFLFVPPASYGPKVWIEDQGPDRYRRALYTFRFRSVPYPMLQTFDAPNGDVSCVRRSRRTRRCRR